MIDLSPLEKWSPNNKRLEINTIDAHTGGEPLRIIINGFPRLNGNTVLEKRNHLAQEFDHLRKTIMLEPRGHADMYGALIVEPENKGSDFGVIFMHNEGYSTGCGHAVIAISTVLVETGIINVIEPETEINMDVPSGTIKSYVKVKNNKVNSVRFLNVPSFVELLDASISIPGLGIINYDLAYGGAYYAIVKGEDVGLNSKLSKMSEFVDIGMKIKNNIIQHIKIEHPIMPEMNFLYGTIFTFDPIDNNNHSRNVCVFANGEVDRSPTGTGVSARAAIHYARNEIKIREMLTIESIIGSTFNVSVIEESKIGSLDAVIPEVVGSANIVGRNTFWVDPTDDIAQGFMLR